MTFQWTDEQDNEPFTYLSNFGVQLVTLEDCKENRFVRLLTLTTPVTLSVYSKLERQVVRLFVYLPALHCLLCV